MRIELKNPRTGQVLRWECESWSEAIETAYKLSFNKLPVWDRLVIATREVLEEIFV